MAKACVLAKFLTNLLYGCRSVTPGSDTLQQRELDAFKQKLEKEILDELIQLLQHMNKFLADLPEGILGQLAKSFQIEDFPLGHVSTCSVSCLAWVSHQQQCFWQAKQHVVKKGPRLQRWRLH